MRKRFLAVLLSAAMALGLGSLPGMHYVAHADEKVTLGQSLELNKDTELSITQNTYETYMAYPFKTSTLKGYYYYVLNGTQPEHSPSAHVSTNTDFASRFASINGTKYLEIGDVLGGANDLKPDTTYYLQIQRFPGIDYKANIKIAFLMDNEADTAALADPYQLGVTKYASIDGAKDLDVWEFKTGSDEYTITAKAAANTVDLYIYSDSGLTNKVNDYTITKDGRTIEMKSLFEKNKTYYIVFKCASNHMEGYTHDYEFKITGKNGTDNAPETDSTQNSDSAQNPDSTQNSESRIKPGSKLASIAKSKYFVTNMTSKVSGKISGKKLTLTKAKGAYLFKKSRMKHNVFTKSQTLGKSKYTYKLARNYKVVYGTKSDGSKDLIKSKSWFNKNFKKGGKMYGKYNIGVCLDKKSQVTLIYVSGFDVGAEQTD